jgi:serine protease Do
VHGKIAPDHAVARAVGIGKGTLSAVRSDSIFILAMVSSVAWAGLARADAPTPGNAAAPRPAVVYCYDRARDQVARVLAHECHGEVVDEATAKAVTERREQRIIHSLDLGENAASSGTAQRLASIGTGFYVDEGGRLITNHHVIDGCAVLKLRASSGAEVQAQVLAVDVQNDLALLQGEASSPAFARFRADDTIGEEGFIATVGYPDQGMPPMEPMITTGLILRSVTSTAAGERLILRAALRHGNSGGPLFDRQGLVIGIVNAKLDEVRYFSVTGREVSDVGAGIPLRVVRDFLRRNGARDQVWPGGETLDGKQILARSTAFVRRVDCWK